MGVHSGKFGTANGLSTLRNWSVSDSQNLAKAIASNTAFGTEAHPGVEDWTGSAQCYGRIPSHMPGETFAFLGYEAPDNDAQGSGIRLSGNVVVTQLVANWNFQAAELLNYQIDFGGHLGLAIGVGAFVSDPSVPALQSPGGLSLQYSTDGGTTWADWTDVATAAWTLTNAVQTYVNSSTFVADSPGPNGRVWTGRKSGPIDWTLAVTEHNTDRTRFKKGDQLALRLPVGPLSLPKYWLLKYGRVKDFTNLQVNRETGAIMQQTVNLEMSGVRDSDGSLGIIQLPDDSVYWPIPQS
jgi:hypothetical protein